MNPNVKPNLELTPIDADGLPPERRAWLESVLDTRLEPGDRLVLGLERGVELHAYEEARQGILDILDRIENDPRPSEFTQEEIDEAIETAMEEVRPSYRRSKPARRSAG